MNADSQGPAGISNKISALSSLYKTASEQLMVSMTSNLRLISDGG